MLPGRQQHLQRAGRTVSRHQGTLCGPGRETHDGGRRHPDFSFPYGNWRGPGHNAIFVEDGTYWLVYHAYDAQLGGISKLRIEALTWDEDGWPMRLAQASSEPTVGNR